MFPWKMEDILMRTERWVLSHPSRSRGAFSPKDQEGFQLHGPDVHQNRSTPPLPQEEATHSPSGAIQTPTTFYFHKQCLPGLPSGLSSATLNPAVILIQVSQIRHNAPCISLAYGSDFSNDAFNSRTSILRTCTLRKKIILS